MLDLPSRTWSQGGWRWFVPQVELAPRCPWCFRFSYSQTSDPSKDRCTERGRGQAEVGEQGEASLQEEGKGKGKRGAYRRIVKE